MQVREIKVAECSPELYKKLYSINLRRRGMMRKTLVKLRAARDCFAYIHYIESENQILAWSLSFPDVFIQRHKSYFYTRRNKRKQGLGAKLFKTVEKCFKKNNLRFKVYPHDHKSAKFFDKCTKGKCTDMSDSLIHVSYYHQG